MNQRILFIFLAIGLSVSINAQTKRYSLSGTLTDASNGEQLIGATISVIDTNIGSVSNIYGFYSLTLKEGNYKIKYSYIGYESKFKDIKLDKNLKINLELDENKKVLNEVVISDNKVDKSNVTQTKMSVIKLDIKQVKKIPILLGEVDIIKAIQLLPGIQQASDGNTLMVVRGGNVDHNLLLLDEVTVYNPSHAVGFFSVFNGDAIKDFEVYKGGIPSIYGGRLASVVDIRMKEGNTKHYQAEGGVGLLSSRFTFEGPIMKDKSSFMISGRRSYFDLFFPLFEQTKNSSVYFYDLNLKTNFKIGEKDKVYASGYFGRDKLGFADFFGLGWGNATGTLRWNHLFNSRLFANTSAIFSRYDFNFDLNIAKNLNFTRSNFIIDRGIKSDLNYYHSPKSNFMFGVESIHHTLQPGIRTPITKESIVTEGRLQEKTAMQSAIYLSNNYKFNNRLSAEYGLRLSLFSNFGGITEYIYQNGNTTYMQDGVTRSGIITDSINPESGKMYNTFKGIEPRINIVYLLNEESSIKASYNRMYQYLHLIQNTTGSTGQEFWIPSDRYILPQRADQVAVGYFRNFRNNIIETSVELYYKGMSNTLEIIDNADLQFNDAIESQIKQGEGRAYGIEFFVRKQSGKNTGWISYSLSKSERKAEGINNDNWYNFRYNRTHYITLVASREISKRVDLSANFIYSTGDAFTAANGQYESFGRVIPIYGQRNGFRFPDYHRMDVSMTLKRKIPDGREIKNNSNWVFSIYNVYSRKNAYSIDFKNDPDTKETAAYKTYLFGIVPAVTYNFKF